MRIEDRVCVVAQFVFGGPNRGFPDDVAVRVLLYPPQKFQLKEEQSGVAGIPR